MMTVNIDVAITTTITTTMMAMLLQAVEFRIARRRAWDQYRFHRLRVGR